MLDMKLHFTSGYHPEGDGQTEQVNQTLEQYLRCYCNYQQDNWSTLLPLAEFTYNNTPSETTGTSPFFANKGYHPNLSIHPKRDMASNRAHEFAVDLGKLHESLKLHTKDAQRRYQSPPTATTSRHQTSKSMTKCTSKRNSFALPNPPKNSLKRVMGPSKSLPNLSLIHPSSSPSNARSAPGLPRVDARAHAYQCNPQPH